MKAIVQHRYGAPADVLRLEEIEPPKAGPGEVLVRVRATTVHPDVWHGISGLPYILRLMGSGLRRPRNPVPGMDLAGSVEAVGPGVTRFAPGDAVFGATHTALEWRNGGAFAEYAAVAEDALVSMPEGVSFEQAATVPTSGFIALLNLQGGAGIDPGQRALVNGAGGGVGCVALQLLRSYGAHVTGVDDAGKEELVRSLGADHYVDYTREDFTQGDERYDLIFDVASTLTLASARRALLPSGTYVLIGHDHFGAATGRVLGSVPRVLTLLLVSRFVRNLPRAQPGATEVTIPAALATLRELLEGGRLTPVVARSFPLAEAVAAMRCLEEGRAVGRIVITP